MPGVGIDNDPRVPATTPQIRRRTAGDASRLPADLHPVLRRVYAARGIDGADQLALELRHLHAPAALRGIDAAAELLHRRDGQQGASVQPPCADPDAA